MPWIDCPPLVALASPKRRSHADYFWRIGRPLARLAERAVETAVCWLDAGELPTADLVGRIVIVQRIGLIDIDTWTGGLVSRDPADWVTRLKRAGALAVVADMDDDTLTDAYLCWLLLAGGIARARLDRLVAEREAWRQMVRAVDAVTVSTSYLAEIVRGWTDRPVSVIPNAIDVAWFSDALRPAQGRSGGAPWRGANIVPSADGTTSIGWAGGRRPDDDLRAMAVAWGRLADRHPDVRFVVAGWQPDIIYRHVDDARIIRIPWLDLDAYPPAYAVDIGCCPLADTPFNRAKSPIKAWEYALAGAAVVASPTVYGGIPCCLPADALADTAAAWTDALELELEVLRFRTDAGLVSPLARHVASRHALADALEQRAAVYRSLVGVAA